ncbi:hypothetical protein BTVI_127029 [Pitangus sulphuratus]|nr:hypothetical protein BTVI_127029 [Pitangus sulphuratus]
MLIQRKQPFQLEMKEGKQVERLFFLHFYCESKLKEIWSGSTHTCSDGPTLLNSHLTSADSPSFLLHLRIFYISFSSFYEEERFCDIPVAGSVQEQRHHMMFQRLKKKSIINKWLPAGKEELSEEEEMATKRDLTAEKYLPERETVSDPRLNPSTFTASQ